VYDLPVRSLLPKSRRTALNLARSALVDSFSTNMPLEGRVALARALVSSLAFDPRMAPYTKEAGRRGKAFDSPTILALLVRDALLYELRRIAMLQYLVVWGSESKGNKARVEFAFYKLISRGSNDPVDLVSLSRLAHDTALFFRLSGRPDARELAALLDEASVDVFGYACSLWDLESGLNPLLEALGLPERVEAVVSGGAVRFIYGVCDERRIGDQRVLLFGRELARSPENVLSIVARNKRNGMMIRREAMDWIFQSKWLARFTEGWRRPQGQGALEALGEGIKERSLALAGIRDREKLVSDRPAFMRQMLSDIVHHELGHKLAKEAMDPELEAFASLYAEGDEDTALYAVSEALADWAPPRGDPVRGDPNRGGAEGSLVSLARASCRDEAQAQRYLWVMLSDSWFVGSGDPDYLRLRSFSAAALILRFIGEDGRFDFGAALSGLEDRYGRLAQLYGDFAKEILDAYRETRYRVGVERFDYRGFLDLALEGHRRAGDPRQDGELLRDARFWANFQALARKYGKGLERREEQVLARQREALGDFMLSLLGDSGEGVEGLAAAVLRRFARLGLPEVPRP
jgi:hypothetical protein